MAIGVAVVGATPANVADVEDDGVVDAGATTTVGFFFSNTLIKLSHSFTVLAITMAINVIIDIDIFSLVLNLVPPLSCDP